MRSERYPRIVFGASAVLFGVIALMWHDADTWQSLYWILKLPSGAMLGACLMAAQTAGGLAMLHARKAPFAAIILSIVYLLSSLACIPGIVTAPGVYAQYGSFFEQFALFSGAIAFYPSFRGAARIGLGLCVVSFTLSQIVYLRFSASLVPKWIPPGQTFWAVLTTVAFALAAIAILLNLRASFAAHLLTLMLALFGVLVWIPRLIAHPESHGNWSEFALTFLIAGAAWMVASVLSL